jgi:dienelactone hydrolase
MWQDASDWAYDAKQYRRSTALNRVLIAAAVVIAAVRLQPSATVVIELPHNDVLVDESIPIVVSGLEPKALVTVRARSGANDNPWMSSAAFMTDAAGRVDLTRMSPDAGSYKEVDPMGLFWSASRVSADEADPSDDGRTLLAAESWTLTAETGGSVVATARIRRRAVAPGVRVIPVRDNGLVGSFYEPTGPGRHPAFLVLGGSGGGVPPPLGPAGGLASHGYAVLSLAYFRASGLPPTLSNIPLEYFAAALKWMSAQPSVDPSRVGVVGLSRGAELALLLGTIHPDFHAVVAYMPSNVIVRGCCDAGTPVAWTLGGRAVASAPSASTGRSRTTDRPEIPVERINGAVLLISGRDDEVWPSTEMADAIMARLRQHRFAHPFVHLAYDHAGHGIGRPFTSTMELNSRRHPLTGRIMRMGGTPSATARARADSWRRMLAFVDEHLRNSGNPGRH